MSCGSSGVDVQDPLAQERRADRLAFLAQKRDLALVGARLPEDVPGLGHPAMSSVILSVRQAIPVA